MEDLYTKTCTHLAVSKRTRVVNEKLTHCLEIMEMIRTLLADFIVDEDMNEDDIDFTAR